MDRRLFIEIAENRLKYDFPINKTWTRKKKTYSTALLKLICGIKHVIQTTESATTKMSIC